MAGTSAGRRATEAHRREQLGIRAGTVAELTRLWPLLDVRRVDDTAPAWFDAVAGVIRRRRAQSSAAGASYFRAFRDAERGGDPVALRPVDDLDPVALAASLMATGPARVKYLTGRGYTPERAGRTSLVTSAGAATRLVLSGGRSAVEAGADADDVRWFRVTDDDPCAWCAMLASRGPTYTSREAAAGTTERSVQGAGIAYHDLCACTPEPCYDPSAPWPGRADEFEQLWIATTGAASGAGKWHAFRQAYEQQRAADRAAAEADAADRAARAAAEQAEAERLAAEVDAERARAEREAAERADAERSERAEREAAQRAEAERLAAEQAAAEAAPSADDLAALSDDQLAAALDQAANDGDYDALDALAGEMQRREEAAAAAAEVEPQAATVVAAAASEDDAAAAGWGDEQEALYQQFEALVAAGLDDESAAAEVYGRSAEQQRRDRAITSLRAQGFVGRSFEDLARKAYRTYTYDRYITAEDACQGHLLNAAGQRANVDPLDLFTGTAARARKYASDELKEWWDQNGRVTFDQYSADLLGDVQESRAARFRTGGEDWLQ